jgi:hypothetical protein
VSRVRGTTVLLASVLALAALVSVASAEAIERVPIPRGPSSVTKDFPPGVSLSLVSPEGYARSSGGGDRGTWTGPRYQASGDASNGGSTSISWTVDFENESKSALEAATKAPRRGWPIDIKGGMSVPHLIRNRIVGTMLGSFVLTRSPAPADASWEAALAFPIAPRIHAIVRFEVRGAAGDSAGDAGTYVVQGWIPASLWNRGQAFWALSGVRLEGNLPPTRVSARATGGGRVVRGGVLDAFRHPLVGIRVALERLSGGGWERVATTRTDRTGAFTVRGVARRGRYRAVAAIGSVAARSPAVAAGG